MSEPKRKHKAKLWGATEDCTLTVEWDGEQSVLQRVLYAIASDSRLNGLDRWRVRLVRRQK